MNVNYCKVIFGLFSMFLFGLQVAAIERTPEILYRSGTENAMHVIGSCGAQVDNTKQIIVVKNSTASDVLTIQVSVDEYASEAKTAGPKKPLIFAFSGLNPSKMGDVDIIIKKVGDTELSTPAVFHLSRQGVKNQRATIDANIKDKTSLISAEIITGCDADGVKNFVVEIFSIVAK